MSCDHIAHLFFPVSNFALYYMSKNITAIRIVFFCQPLVLGAWFPRIPQIQTQIGLGEGALALALMGTPIGLLLALTFGGRLAEYLGTQRLLIFGLSSYLATMPLPALSWSPVSLFFTLSISGLAIAIAGLSLNVTAAEIEKQSPQPIMNGCHGFWSMGVLAGSLIGSGLAELALSVALSQVLVSVLTCVPLLWSAYAVDNFHLENHQAENLKKFFNKPHKVLVFISLFTFGISMTEGAMADWSAVYMTNIFGSSPGIAGLSYTIFALFVALGRFGGDGLKAKMSTPRMAQSFVTIALVGLIVTRFAPSEMIAFLGIAFLGLGVSVGFPLSVTAASNLRVGSSASNVAFLTQMSLCGFLIGPPLIGLVAEMSDMRWGLSMLLFALFLALFFANALKEEEGNHHD